MLMIPMMGLERASSLYPSAFINTFLKKREKCGSPYEVSPCRRPEVELIGFERS